MVPVPVLVGTGAGTGAGNRYRCDGLRDLRPVPVPVLVPVPGSTGAGAGTGPGTGSVVMLFLNRHTASPTSANWLGGADGKGARDSTKYGKSRTSARSYFRHHVQRIAMAAKLGDAKAIYKNIQGRRQHQMLKGKGGRATVGA